MVFNSFFMGRVLSWTHTAYTKAYLSNFTLMIFFTGATDNFTFILGQ